LWKNKKVNVSEITKEIKVFSVLVLTPSPLDYKRQEYYQNIRFLLEMNLKVLLAPNQYILTMKKIFKLTYIN
jgi:hypothetical protein